MPGCDCVFETSLHYASPAHGGWGVLKAGQLIPESYHLFVSPAACGRHGALAARLENRNRTVSYLHLTEQSIVSGDYEQEIAEAVDAVLAVLKRQDRIPRVFTIFVSCIDDLLGTDLDALTDALEAAHPGLRFISCHMNPTTTDTGIPPAVNIQNKVYSTLNPASEADRGVNLIGNLQAIRQESELFPLLAQMGAEPVRHISQFRRFDDYQDMAKSRLNLVLAPSGKYASEQMKRRLDIPFQMALTAFQPKNITKCYEGVAAALDAPCPKLELYEHSADEALSAAAKELDGLPVVVDGEAITRPFELARALLEHGFTVHSVYEQKLKPSDKADYAWLRETHPDIPIIQSLHHKVTVDPPHDVDCIAVGYSAGYLSGAKHVVNLGGQNGLYGYRGVVTLMQMLQEAAGETADMRRLLEDTVLVI